jgi:hypothetical protein
MQLYKEVSSRMQNNQYQKHQRGSSPPVEELQERLNHWVKNLRSISDSHDDALTVRCVNRPAEHGKDVSGQKPDSNSQSVEEQRWQDDGGESGEAVC